MRVTRFCQLQSFVGEKSFLGNDSPVYCPWPTLSRCPWDWRNTATQKWGNNESTQEQITE